MKIFIAGATGAVGRRLIPALIQLGHQVIGMSRSKDKMKMIHDRARPRSSQTRSMRKLSPGSPGDQT